MQIDGNNQYLPVKEKIKQVTNQVQWERKGKLKKKNLNNDIFKDRYFELVKDNLNYYKNERFSKFLNLKSA